MQTKTSTLSSLKHVAFQDNRNPSDWRVEAIDPKSGDVLVTIFCGPHAMERSEEYAIFKNAQ